MKLLFDANLSPDLVRRLEDLYPGSSHVYSFGIESSDTAVWEFAKQGNSTIVSKDSDFHQRALVLGAPPKVVWVRLGNCSTAMVETLLRQRFEEMRSFWEGTEESLLAIP